MFGRLTRSIALAAMVTHLWVTMVVSPWHHLVEHRLVSAAPNSETETARPVSGCRCRHHAQRSQAVATCDLPANKSAGESKDQPAPTVPHDHDDCQICQVLAQPFTTLELPVPVVTLERLEFSPPVSAVQPLLGASIEPVSRGPPAV